MTDPYSEFEHLANLLALRPGVSKSKMFGMPSIKVNGKAFAGLSGDSMMFKMADASQAGRSGDLSRALALEGAKLFDPMGGRPMKEWAAVPSSQAELWQELAEAALDYVLGMTEKG